MKITKEALTQMLADNPNVTQKELAEAFGCGTTTVGRKLREFGLRTKGWNERQHSAESKQKMSRCRKGKMLGSQNPNFGEKKRPWLEGDNAPFRVWHRQHPDFGEHQRGENNPIHKVLHLYKDPEYLKNITRGIKAHVDRRRGSTYEEVYGFEKASEYKEKLRAASPNRLAQFKRRETEPERIVRSILDALGMTYQAQAPLGYYTVDFLVPSQMLVVQADGDYWHANPFYYGDALGKPLSKNQHKVRRLDASCDAYLTNRGFKVIRFWEYDLKNSLDVCIQKLKEVAHVC